MKVHIVIPFKDKWELTHQLLWDLYRKERENIDTVYLVDDASDEMETLQGYGWWKKEELPSKFDIKVLTNEENLNFTLSANYGIKTAVKRATSSDDIITVISNDVQIHSKFISQMKGIFEESQKRVVGGKLLFQDTGWNKFGESILPYLEGWLLATTAENWERLGYFDSIYAPHDYEDMDLSYKAMKDGYELVPLNNAGIKHGGGKSIGYNPKREEVTRANRIKFATKWKLSI